MDSELVTSTDCSSMSSNPDFSKRDSLSITDLPNIQSPSFDSSNMDALSLAGLPNKLPNLDFPNDCEKYLIAQSSPKIKLSCQKPALHNVVQFGPGSSRAGEKQSSFLQLMWFYWLRVQATAKIFRFPCQKPTLRNIVPFRPGNSRAGEKQSTFPQLVWSYSEPERTTYICQDFDFRSSSPVPIMPIRCRRFNPRPSDVLVETYEASDGEIILLERPPFACVDIESPKMRGVLETYIKDCQAFLMEDILATASDDIYRLGLREAVRFANEREGSVVSPVLEILACVHANFKEAIQVGSDTLDVTPIFNEKFSIHGKSPVPSVLDHQIDTLYIYHMHSLMKEVTKRLNQLIFAKNSIENWYEIFLAVFVLLMSLEKVYMAQLKYLRKCPQPHAAEISYDMISKWKASAKSLLHPYRYVLRGMIPFSPSWDPNKQKQVELDAMSLEYIRTMSKILDQRKAELSALREEGGENSHARPLTWLVELFLD